MKYLILPTAQAIERNSVQVNGSVTQFFWEAIDLGNGTTALLVGDGQGLSPEELAQCVEVLPNI